MKKLLICLLALMLTVPALAEAPGGLRPRRRAVRAEVAADVRFEGEGYESPEEAVVAYLEALKKGDVEGMLATFAIETYVAEMDAQADLERMGVFQPSYGMRLPLGGDYQRQVAVAVRYGQLAESLASQWMLYSWPDGYAAFDGASVALNEDGDAEAFLAGLAEGDAAALWQGDGGRGLRRARTDVQPVFGWFTEPGQAGGELWLRRSEIVSVVAKFDIGGEEWYQCMDVACWREVVQPLRYIGHLTSALLLGRFERPSGKAPPCPAAAFERCNFCFQRLHLHPAAARDLLAGRRFSTPERRPAKSRAALFTLASSKCGGARRSPTRRCPAAGTGPRPRRYPAAPRRAFRG